MMNDNLNNSNLPDYEQYEYVDELDFRVGFGKRFLAWFIDALIVLIVLTAISISTGLIERQIELGTEMQGQIVLDISQLDPDLQEEMREFSFQWALYYSVAVFVLLTTLEVFYGATIGKLILGLRVANSNRTWAGFQQLLLRAFIKYISIFFNFLFLITMIDFISTIGTLLAVILIIGCFVALSEKKQTLHDLIAGTAVFYKAEIMTPEEAEKVRNI